MTISSQASFAGFLQLAWDYLTAPWNADAIDVRLQTLYDIAAEYNPNNVAPKAALRGSTLYANMAQCMGAFAGGRQVRIQKSGHWLDMSGPDIAAFRAYYLSHAGGPPAPHPAQANRSVRRYVHVYPNPLRPGLATDWRVEVNLQPSAIAAGTQALVPLLDPQADIGHIKFYMPAGTKKPDSVIVYLRKTGTYAALQNAVTTAVNGLAVQARMGAMVDEIAPGVGVASEPPKNIPGFAGRGGSFTSYRVLATYIAYETYGEQRDPIFSDFRRILTADTMPLLGLDPLQPHDQGPPLTADPRFAGVWGRLRELQRIWKP
jgi:hypothetical protein